MSRRAATLLVAGLLILILGMVAALIPVPYVALRPGPTSNTLGRLGKTSLIQISGAKTYPTDGHLNFVTVAYQGGPGNRIDLFTALRGWLNPDVAVVPEETIFPKNVPTKKVEQENTEEMTDSQESATAAAMRELHMPTTAVVYVDSAQKGLPAEGRLKPGDVIVAVDGKKLTQDVDLPDLIGQKGPRQKVRLEVVRGRERRTVTVTLAPRPSTPPPAG